MMEFTVDAAWQVRRPVELTPTRRRAPPLQGIKPLPRVCAIAAAPCLSVAHLAHIFVGTDRISLHHLNLDRLGLG